MSTDTDPHRTGSLNFLEQIIERDLASGAVTDVVTRFPPEPNGYLHVGHAAAVCLQFGLARDFNGRCHLRFDDTNPETEDMEYVESAIRDIQWLGFDWKEHLYFASDYFEQLYDFAVQLVTNDKAYVDSLNEEEIRAYRGTVTEAGRHSPHRDRPIEESLDLLRRMRAGEFANGAHVLRAKIDMASNNMLMRDPVLYRIKHAPHYRRGDDWCIYPLYDFAHPLSDAIEGISHSICTLEFDVHRPLYDWLVEAVTLPPRPHQYEYARRNLEYTVVSKRKLLRLVKEGHVDGWNDPRMPTIAGLRRRGVSPEALRHFADLMGIAKSATRIDISLLEHAIRDDLNQRAPRVMAVSDPLRVTLSNWPEDRIEWLDASYWPHDVPREGTRPLPFGKTLYIDRSDFAEDPPPRFHRLSPGAEVRLRHGYVIRCDEVQKDAEGAVIGLVCSVDLDTRSGSGSDGGRRVKGTVHWVEASNAVPVELRLYDRLFGVANPDDVPEGTDFLDNLNPESKTVNRGWVEHSVAGSAHGDRYQFERLGYFIVDEDSGKEAMVFNRTITLRDTWARKGQSDKTHASGGNQKRHDSGSTGSSAARGRGSAPATQANDSPPIPELTPEQQDLANSLENSDGLGSDDAAVLASDPWLYDLYVATSQNADSVSVANWVLHEVQRIRKGVGTDGFLLAPEALAGLIQLVDDQAISSRTGKELLSEVALSGEDPVALVESRGLRQIDDSDEIARAAARVVSANPDKAAAFRGGKAGLIGFFMGQLMRETGGKANPDTARKALQEALASDG